MNGIFFSIIVVKSILNLHLQKNFSYELIMVKCNFFVVILSEIFFNKKKKKYLACILNLM